MENDDNRTKPHKAAREGNEGRIQSVSPVNTRKFYPAFNAKGERIRKVYFRLRTDGSRTFYARVVDPKSGTETWQSSPDGSVAMAKALVADAERAVGEARVNAYSEALGAIRRRIDGWTIGRVLDEYPRAAEARRAATGHPSADTQLSYLSRARRIFKGHEGESVANAPEVAFQYAVRYNREHGGGEPTGAAASEYTMMKAVFAPWALEAFERAGMPHVDLRWRKVAEPPYQFELQSQELRDRTIAEGKRELAEDSAVGRAFLLQFFCAMSAADACRARWDWMDEGGTVHYRRNKTGKRADPRLPADVAVRWRELASGSDSPFVLPFESDTRRHNFLLTDFADWMTELGWRTKKKGHELRKLMCSIWYTTPGIGAEWTQAWSGDSLEVLQKHYARLLPEKAPPAPTV